MIALDDISLARIVIGAGAVPRNERGAWLKRVAAELEWAAGHSKRDNITLARTSPAAAKQQRYRDRIGNGRVILRLEADACALTHALISVGVLAPGAVDDRRAIELAIEQLLQDWSAAWSVS